jgi:Spy/CpxP family protein refolding chaperone
MIRTFLAALSVILTQACFAQAPGQPPGMRPPPGNPPMMQGRMRGGDRMARLNLTEEQRAQVDRIREETRRASWNAMGQIMTERHQLRELMRQDKVDPNAVVEQQKKIDDLRREVLKNRLEGRNRVMAMLTPEQQRIYRSRPMRGGGPA